ncbi:MAG: winged helix-turn-helix domain-containing protein [Gammaproteobacteria bacterium]|nr:winged helix-turn-helix domain-containing protein [Gammaproteobacteria bacterium]
MKKIRFADIELNGESFEIRRAGELIHVEPKIFDLLVHLAKNPGIVFSTDELIGAVWGGRAVSDAAVVSCIAHARKAIGDDGRAQRYIKTIRRRGFRFIGEVEQQAQTPDNKPTGDAFSPIHSIEAHADPSMMVIPFQLLSKDTQDNSGKHYVQTLISTLEIVLMRIPLLQMSSYSLIHDDSDNLPSGRGLYNHYGIDYLLEGSVRAESGRVVLSVQLSDARRNIRLWAEQFILEGDFNSSVDNSVHALVAKLEPQLYKAIYDRVRSSSTAGGSRSLYLEASGILALKGWHHDSFTTASSLLRQSWERDREFAHAASYLSLVLGLGYRLNLLKQHKGTYQEAIDAAESAIQLDDMNSSVLGLAGCALADLGFNDRGLLLLKNAVELNPSNAQACSALGGVYLTTRQVKLAVDYLKQGMRMSPLDSRLSVWGGLLSTALRVSGDLSGAVREAARACQRDHRAYMPQVILAGAQLAGDNPGAAVTALHEAYRIKPDLSEDQIYSLLGKRLGRSLVAKNS